MRDVWRLLTVRGQAVVAGGVVLVLAGLLLGVRDLTRVGLLATLLPLLAAGLARRHDLGLSVTRTATPSRLRPDEPAEVTVRIRNDGRRSTPILMAEEAVDYSLGDRPRFVVPSLAPGEERTVTYVVRSHLRGRHRVGPLGIRVKDPFGLTARTAAHRASASVLVLPRAYALAPSASRGSELGADGTVPHRVSLNGEDDASIREYREGDDLRRIHWPATARTGELMVRQEDRPARRRAVVLLDTRRSAHPDTGPHSSLEWAVSATASIGLHLLDLGCAVHVVAADSGASTGVLVSEAADELLDHLAEVDACSDADFLAAERHAAVLAGGGGLVVAVLGALEDRHARSLASLRRSGGQGLALVVAGSAERSPLVERTVAVLTSSGWAARGVTTAVPVATAWVGVTGGDRTAVTG